MASREHSLRMRIAREHRHREPDPDVLAALQREHAVARIEDHARKILASSPPLTIDQRRHLAEVMLGEAMDAPA
jgi:hypothetical protein